MSKDDKNSRREIKAVIFDLDDTLVNEIDYVRSGLKEVAKYLREEFELDFDDLFLRMWALFALNRVDVFGRLLREYDIFSSELVSKCINVYRSHLPNINLRDGVENLLRDLSNNGYQLGIITDGRPEGQWNKIKATGLGTLITWIIVTDELGGIEFRKPCNAAFKMMLSRMNVSACHAAYIGDNTEKDFIAPNALGMHTILLLNEIGLHSQVRSDRSKFVAKDINDLRIILKRQ